MNPERIGSYLVQEVVGKGGMGLVYRVERDGALPEGLIPGNLG